MCLGRGYRDSLSPLRADLRQKQQDHCDALKALEVLHADERQQLAEQHSSSLTSALQEAQQKFESQMEELRAQHVQSQRQRAVQHTQELEGARAEALRMFDQNQSQQLARATHALQHQMQKALQQKESEVLSMHDKCREELQQAHSQAWRVY